MRPGNPAPKPSIPFNGEQTARGIVRMQRIGAPALFVLAAGHRDRSFGLGARAFHVEPAKAHGNLVAAQAAISGNAIIRTGVSKSETPRKSKPCRTTEGM